VIDDQVVGAVLAVILAVGVFSVSQPLLAGRVSEAFSELAVLGPGQKIGDYPRSLLVGEAFTLYLYVGNHEGRSAYYRVYVKLGDRSGVVDENTSLAVEPMAFYDVVLEDNQTWLRPVTLSIGREGVDLRLVFELWMYRPELGSFTYDGRWLQLWLNVTRPV
jgi:uncharacterized membrane protein